MLEHCERDDLSNFWSICLFFIIFPVGKTVSPCPGGQEYECEKDVEADCSKGCLNGTISEESSPGSCGNNCCTVCYDHCRPCSYGATVSMLVLNKTWNSDFAIRRSPAFTKQEHEIQASFCGVFNASSPSKIHTHVVVLQLSPAHSGIQILISIKSNNLTTKQKVLNILRQYEKEECIGSLQVSVDSLVIMSEDSSTVSPHKMNTVRIDVVELCITGLVAAIILCAVGSLLYYLCTTPSQRARQCRACRGHQVQQSCQGEVGQRPAEF